MKIGMDLGGTKIEIIALDEAGGEVLRRRIPTPRGSYRAIVEAITELVHKIEAELAQKGHLPPHSVGIAMPGTLSPFHGRVINSNSTEMNGEALQSDLEEKLQRPLRFANDANCLAVSEAVDGAARGAKLTFAAILGTGCGAGLAINGQAWEGAHKIAGEWGHNPLPWPQVEEVEHAPLCYCGRRGCLETWISGTGFARDFAAKTGKNFAAPAIIAAAQAGDEAAQQSFASYIHRLARGLAHVVNLLDPDVIVLGGGMSNVSALYALLPEKIAPFVFSERFITPIRRAQHGDSSGVRGAAWLWKNRQG